MYNLLIEFIPVIFLSIIVGAAIGVFWQRKATKQNVLTEVQSATSERLLEIRELQGKLASQSAVSADLETRLTAANDESHELQEKYVTANSQLARLEEKVARIPNLESGLQENQQRLSTEQSALSEAQQRIKVLETELDNEKVSAQEKLALLERVEEKFNKQFRLTATEVLDENSKKFSQLNKDSLGNLITPLKEQLDKFDKRIGDSREADAKERQQVRGELKQIAELGLSLSERAENLTNALRGDVKAQGTWGEMILETVLEKSGLQKDREYIIQASGKNGEGTLIRPDVLVTLPDNKAIVIDSKVSLKAYEAAINAETDEARNLAITQHVQSVRNHILGLSKKNYQDIIGSSSLDFVLMFVPNESALTLALNHSPELFDLAIERNIGLVSPNLLMISLRTVENIWRTEKQNQNAQEIARQAGLLYDKVVGFTEELINIGHRIEQAGNAYDKALNRLKTGSGNIIGRVEKLKKLGARSSKSLPKLVSLNEEEPMTDTVENEEAK
jgi:DNA recombination protein RmuC